MTLNASNIHRLQRIGRVSHHVCAICALIPRRTITYASPRGAAVASRSTRQSHGRLATGRRVGRRLFSSEVKEPATSVEESKLAAIEELRLRTEFEENNDIREYLRKWQETRKLTRDPIRGPGTSNSGMNPNAPWTGNLFSDSYQFYDAEGDELRARDEKATDIFNPGDEGAGIDDFLQLGDLVAMAGPDGTSTLAVYVRSVLKQQQFYTDNGKWRVAFPRDLDYVVKNFLDPSSLKPLLPYFPTGLAEVHDGLQNAIEGGIPRGLGAPILQSMWDFDLEVQEFFRENSRKLDEIYELVADEHDKTEYTLKTLATKALNVSEEDLTPVMLFAVYQAVRRVPFSIENDRSSLFTDYYLVRPKQLVRLMNFVVNWVHVHQNHLASTGSERDTRGSKSPQPVLQSFLQKAQRLIQSSRKVRSPTTMASLGPTAQTFVPGKDGNNMVFREMETEAFNESDRTIVKFLQLFSIPPRRMSSGPLKTTGSHIMRATGMYSALGLSAASTPLFLQELGVFAPWENLKVLDQSLALPGHGISPAADKLWEDVRAAGLKHSSSELNDQMQDLRTNWGDLPVYCVDDPSAQEIDDGVSLERVPDTDDTFWIRVHVANPSAFLPSDDITMQYAASRYSTVYTPERSYPMLPSELTQARFSLAPGRPTLTFSAKMNLQGDILETDVRNGIINNVIYLTHDQVRSLFEPDQDRVSTDLRVGVKYDEKPPRTEMRATLSNEDETTFHTLRKLMLAFREHRLKNGAMEWPDVMDTSVSVTGGTEPMKPYNMQVATGRYFLGDPIIRMRMCDVDPHEVPDQTKRNLVAPLMNLACYIAGRWCADRNIPAMYDGTWYHPEYPKLTRERMAEYGGSKWLHLGAPKGVTTSTPLPHTPLGLDVYLKSTSPLRRYSDLMAHYQIEAALRHEHETNKRFSALEQHHPSVLPFTKEDVDKYISGSRWKRNRINDVDSGSKQFWACLLLFRAFYFGECSLPETFECVLHQPRASSSVTRTAFGHGYSAQITSLGVRCQVLFPENFPEVDILSVVEAKISAVDMSRSLVVMEATRFVKHFERKGEWR